MINFIDLERQRHSIKSRIEMAVNKVIAEGNFILGPEVSELEKQLENYVGVPCVTVANGTDALYISMLAANIGAGDEVLVPSFTWVSTAETVCQLGANPVFVDIDDNFNIDIEKAKTKISEKTRAIIPVSMFGTCPNLLKIDAFAKEYNLLAIEDAAQSFGAKSEGNISCSVLDISTTSFFPAKPLGCYGDGGAIFVKNLNYLEKIKQIPRHRQQGRYNYKHIGVNSRRDTIQAAVLIEKLNIFEDEIVARNNVAKRYKENLADFNLVKTPFIPNLDNRSVWAQYTILLDTEIKTSRGFIMEKLKDLGIPTALYYPVPLHTSGVYSRFETSDLSKTEFISSRVLSLPMHPYLKNDEIDEVSEKLISTIRLI